MQVPNNPIYRGNSISQSQQGKDRSVVCARSEIPRLLLLCAERQRPTRGASQVQSQDEVKAKRTSRSNGWGYAKRKQKLKEYIRGWVGYYHFANMKRLLLETDEWLRRRIRMCIWKAWKKVKTKVANLIRCGINKYKAYEWGNTRKGYWRIADSYILHRAITNEYLCRAGYATLMEAYLEWYPK